MMRSFLFVPADSEKKLEKGLTCGADALIVDFEDSVALSRKEEARRIGAAFIEKARAQTERPRLFVRINALDTDLVEADLDAIMRAAPDGVVLPKSSGGADVSHLAANLAVREAEFGLSDGATQIIAIATETGASMFGLGSYGGASHRLVGLTWGAEDLSADLGAETNRREDGGYAEPYRLARNLTLFGSAAASVDAIDAINANFRDVDALRRECAEAKRDGFVSKMAIHPAQIPIINEAFTPSPESLARARAVIAAFDAQPDAGVVGVDGEMLDRPHLLRARRLLKRVEG